jgi:RNA polymerase sigma-70 factor, ECF subfamily
MTAGRTFTPRTPRSDADKAREIELVRQAQGGDTSAFEELYRANVNRVYAVCYRMSRNATRAEELTQDVFVRAWNKLGLFRGESAFFTWLYPLAVNLIFSERRVTVREESRFTASEDIEGFEPAVPAAKTGLRMDLEKAIQHLPAGARRIFVLHDVEGYKHEEIANMTGLAVGTSKAQLHRARRMLQEALCS